MDHPGGRRAQFGRLRVAAFAALTLVLCTPIAAGAATADRSVHKVRVLSDRIWTNTGINVAKGVPIAITATGVVRFGDGPISRVAPDGIPRGTTCNAIEAGARPAPKLDCWR